MVVYPRLHRFPMRDCSVSSGVCGLVCHCTQLFDKDCSGMLDKTEVRWASCQWVTALTPHRFVLILFS